VIRSIFLKTYSIGYEWLARPIIFRASAQTAHEQMKGCLRLLDRMPAPVIEAARRLSLPHHPVIVGGVTLDSPLILAAGLVKGDGFDSEEAALQAMQRNQNIIPGWRNMPRLVGPIEYGSFTRWPRLGNSGTVVWRDVPNRSTQNRVGLRNPGVNAAAEFLVKRQLPKTFGINLAVSPGVDDPAEQSAEVLAGLAAFVERGLRPAWFTLNLSCPNTEDDPNGHQTAEQTAHICRAAVNYLQGIPLWVKIGPTLSDEQYGRLMHVFAETGVRAVVATNTLPMPAPDNPSVMGGVAGQKLLARALAVVEMLANEKMQHQSPVDVVGCGGISTGADCRQFLQAGAAAVQYWSVMIYRGPLAGAVIAQEAKF